MSTLDEVVYSSLERFVKQEKRTLKNEINEHQQHLKRLELLINPVHYVDMKFYLENQIRVKTEKLEGYQGNYPYIV